MTDSHKYRPQIPLPLWIMLWFFVSYHRNRHFDSVGNSEKALPVNFYRQGFRSSDFYFARSARISFFRAATPTSMAASTS